MPNLSIQPSLLAADIGRLADECRRAADAGADGLHLDIMDAHFVRNLSFGPEVVKLARRTVSLPLSVHLMMTEPQRYVEAFCAAGATVLQIHQEARCDVAAVLAAIRAQGARAGLTLNPETPAAAAFPWLDAGQVDEVLCMSVHPGFGGQAFLPHVIEKARVLRQRRPELDISIDGGIGPDNAPACAAAGVNIFIAGTTLFRAPDMAAAVAAMRAGIREAAAGAARSGS